MPPKNNKDRRENPPRAAKTSQIQKAYVEKVRKLTKQLQSALEDTKNCSVLARELALAKEALAAQLARRNSNQEATRIECETCTMEMLDVGQHIPRVLVCGHTFCQRCLEQFVNRKTIKCFYCQTVTNVAKGVSKLPKNFALLAVGGE